MGESLLRHRTVYIMMKILVSLPFLAYALAAPQFPPPHHAAPLVHAAPYAPAPYHPVPVIKEAPKPFAYEYGGADAYGRHFAKTETQDEYGVVQGEYRVEQPDGRVRIVTYHADHENGFVADVKYEGEAHPVEPYHAPKHPAPY